MTNYIFSPYKEKAKLIALGLIPERDGNRLYMDTKNAFKIINASADIRVKWYRINNSEGWAIIPSLRGTVIHRVFMDKDLKDDPYAFEYINIILIPGLVRAGLHRDVIWF
jgi:hypothetical protein